MNQLYYKTALDTPVEGLFALCSSNSDYLAICDDEIFWKKKIEKDFVTPEAISIIDLISWKKFYYGLHDGSIKLVPVWVATEPRKADGTIALILASFLAIRPEMTHGQLNRLLYEYATQTFPGDLNVYISLVRKNTYPSDWILSSLSKNFDDSILLSDYHFMAGSPYIDNLEKVYIYSGATGHKKLMMSWT